MTFLSTILLLKLLLTLPLLSLKIVAAPNDSCFTSNAADSNVFTFTSDTAAAVACPSNEM